MTLAVYRHSMRCCRRLEVAFSSIVTTNSELILLCSTLTVEAEGRQGTIAFLDMMILVVVGDKGSKLNMEYKMSEK